MTDVAKSARFNILLTRDSYTGEMKRGIDMNRVHPSHFGRKVCPICEDSACETKNKTCGTSRLIDSAKMARAVASHVLRRGASELAAEGSFDSFRD